MNSSMFQQGLIPTIVGTGRGMCGLGAALMEHAPRLLSGPAPERGAMKNSQDNVLMKDAIGIRYGMFQCKM